MSLGSRNKAQVVRYVSRQFFSLNSSFKAEQHEDSGRGHEQKRGHQDGHGLTGWKNERGADFQHLVLQCGGCF